MNDKITQQDIIKRLSEKHSMDLKDTKTFVSGMFALIEEALINDSIVKIKGLGTFKLVDVENRESINVNTGERFQIKEHSKISFTPDSALKEHINRPFSQFETVLLNEDANFDDLSDFSDNDLKTISNDTKEQEIVLPNVDEISSTDKNQAEDVVSNQDVEVQDISLENETDKDENEAEAEIDTNVLNDNIVEEKLDAQSENIIEKEENVEHSINNSEEKNDETLLSDGSDETVYSKINKEETNSKNKMLILSCVIIIFIAIISICLILFYNSNNTVDKSRQDIPISTKVISHNEDNALNTDEHKKNDDSFDKISNEIKEATSDENVNITNEGNLSKKEIINDGTIDKKEVKSDLKLNENKSEASAKNNVVLKKDDKFSTSVKNSPGYDENLNYKICALKRNHKVVQGETLRTIALKYYGTRKFWHFIYDYNSTVIKDMNHLKLGVTLKIPELKVQK